MKSINSFYEACFWDAFPPLGVPSAALQGLGSFRFTPHSWRARTSVNPGTPAAERARSWVWAEHPLTHSAGRTVVAKRRPHRQHPLVPALCPQPGARRHLRFALSDQPVPPLWLLLMYSKLRALAEFVIPSALGSGDFLLQRVAAGVPANRYSS